MTLTTETKAVDPRAQHDRAPRQSPARRRRKTASAIRAAAIVLVLLVFLLPIFWMILASLKTGLEITNPDRIFSLSMTLENYVRVFAQQDFLKFIINSFVVAAAATLISLIVGVPAAYAISRFKIHSATAFVLLARVIPGVALLVPWYFLFAQMGLIGGYPVLIMSHIFVSLPLIIAIMVSFFDDMSIELEEAGRIDGLTVFGTFIRITAPLAVPGMATSAILSFIFSWNNFLFALILSGEQTKTLPVAIFNFIAYMSVDWGGLMAASVVITLPVIVMTLFVQKYIVSGLSAGATKG